MRTAWLLWVLAACDATGGEQPIVIDAAPDAPPIPVVALDSCPSQVVATIQDSATMFIPKDTTIAVGEVAKFIITAEHFVIPNTLSTTDPALMIKRGETKCFRFNVPGVYNFLCGAHSFLGSITVE